MIPYGQHEIEQQDIEAVTKVLKEQFLTQGEQVPAFEKAISEYTGANYAVAVNSGTSALHVACIALGVSSGDIVWTSPNSFVASANCALYCNAEIDFVDIDANTRNISIAKLEEKLHWAQQENKLPKVIIPVHFAGDSCNMKQIRALTEPLGIKILEDASHALGGTYLGAPVGSCDYSDACVFSFHPVKPITTAEGGMVVTNDKRIFDNAVMAAKHGITRDMSRFVNGCTEPWYYEQQQLGYNYRLSDLHAALGLSQLSRLDQFTQRRRALARNYHQLLATLPVSCPQISSVSESAWHLYAIELPFHDRASVFRYMRDKGIGVNVHYIPIHTQPYFCAKGFYVGQFPVAEAYYKQALTLPLFPSLTFETQQQVVNVLSQALEHSGSK